MKKSPKQEISTAKKMTLTGEKKVCDVKHGSYANDDKTQKIISEVKRGNTVAFIELLGIYSHTISALARSFSLPDSEYEDLCQEGRMALYRASMSFDATNGAKFSTFAVSCIKNAMITLCNKYNATNRPITFDGIVDEQVYVSGGEMSQTLSFGEVIELLSDGTNGMFSSYERRVMSLKVSGYKVSEIAKIVGKSSKSVENTLFRARKKLKNKIG